MVAETGLGVCGTADSWSIGCLKGQSWGEICEWVGEMETVPYLTEAQDWEEPKPGLDLRGSLYNDR